MIEGYCMDRATQAAANAERSGSRWGMWREAAHVEPQGAYEQRLLDVAVAEAAGRPEGATWWPPLSS